MQSARARLCELAGVTAGYKPRNCKRRTRHAPAQSRAAQAFALFHASRGCTHAKQASHPAARGTRDSEIFPNDEHAIASASVAETQHPRAGAMKVTGNTSSLANRTARVDDNLLLGEHRVRCWRKWAWMTRIFPPCSQTTPSGPKCLTGHRQSLGNRIGCAQIRQFLLTAPIAQCFISVLTTARRRR